MKSNPTPNSNYSHKCITFFGVFVFRGFGGIPFRACPPAKIKHTRHLEACVVGIMCVWLSRNHLDSLWRASIAHVNDIVEVITHGHKQVEE